MASWIGICVRNKNSLSSGRILGPFNRLAGLALTIAAVATALSQTPYTFYSLGSAPSVSYAPAAALAASATNSILDAQTRRLAAWLSQQVAQATGGIPVPSGGHPGLVRQQQALERLRQATLGSLEIHFREVNHTPVSIRGTQPPPAAAVPAVIQPGFDPAERAARAFLRNYGDLFLLRNADLELQRTALSGDDLGRTHVRFSQSYQGLTVWPCELGVHLDPAGRIDAVSATTVPTPEGLSTTPQLTPGEAHAAARLSLPLTDLGSLTPPELIIYAPLDAPPKLAWKFDADGGASGAWRLIVDAGTGEVLSRVSLVHQESVIGSGADFHGRIRPLGLWRENNRFYMVDATRFMFDPTSQPPFIGRGVIEIYDAGGRETQNPTFSAGLVQSEAANSGWSTDAVEAAYGLSLTYEYYRERFGRNSLTGTGDSIRALIHYGQNVENAFWYGTTRTMVFGDGFARDIAIAGHELTHGVIDSIGNGGILEYRNQSGAMNEALSDIFGEMVEARDKNGQPDWLKTDPLNPTNRDRLAQDYANPRSVRNFTGNPNPSKMSEFFNLPLQADQGGVHVNSSIINHCFYLLAQGMPEALGMADAERVFYRAMTAYLQKQSQFTDLRQACITGARDVFGPGSVQEQRTRQAFDLVEIFDAPTAPAPAPLPVINAPDSTLFMRFDPAQSAVVLGRRETALGDGPSGVILNPNQRVTPQRISVSGDGGFAVFVTGNRDVGFLRTDGQGLEFGGMAGTVHSIAMAPGGTRYAIVPVNPNTGEPMNQIRILDIASGQQETIPLLAPIADGAAQDIVKFADAMDFMPDGNVLIYDALSEIPVAGSQPFRGWTLFALDLAGKQILTIIQLNPGLDFGNPHLGSTRSHLLTHEVIDRQTGVSTVVAADLLERNPQPIATMTQAGIVGFPTYTGDDRAIIYTQVDLSTATTVSLLRQAVEADGITPVGQPTLWLADADYAAVYRRGTFTFSNAPPQVQITSPAAGQNFNPPDSIQVTVTATDPDGSIARVQLFAGSSEVGEDTTAPYSFAVPTQGLPTGTLLLTARAVDNLGAAADSSPVQVSVGGAPAQPVRIEALLNTAGALQLTILGGAPNDTFQIQVSTNLVNWSTLQTLVRTGANVQFVDPETATRTHRFYKIKVGND